MRSSLQAGANVGDPKFSCTPEQTKKHFDRIFLLLFCKKLNENIFLVHFILNITANSCTVMYKELTKVVGTYSFYSAFYIA